MFALLAGSPKGNCLLIDDNLYNDNKHSNAARHERDPASSPMPSLAGWPNPLSSSLQATRTARARKYLIQ
jgi:hypothetical protein